MVLPCLISAVAVVVQNHVHARQAGSRRILLLTVQRDVGLRRIAHFQQERTGAAGRVVDGGGVGRLRTADADDLRHDAAHFGRRVELTLALAAFGGEMAHQVFVGVAEDVVALRAIFTKVERLVLEDGNQIGEPVDDLLTAAEFARIVKIRHVRQLVGLGQRSDDFFVDLVADVGPALEGDHVLEAGAVGHRNRCVRLADEFVRNIFDEQQDEHVVLVLAGVHATA